MSPEHRSALLERCRQELGTKFPAFNALNDWLVTQELADSDAVWVEASLGVERYNHHERQRVARHSPPVRKPHTLAPMVANGRRLQEVIERALLVQAQGGSASSWEEMYQAFGHEDIVFGTFLDLIREGCITEPPAFTYSLVPAGQIRLERYGEADALSSRWQFLRNETTDPRLRGHELEELFADLARFDGAEAKTRVRTKGEENDVYLAWGTEAWLVSCKRIKTPVANEHLDLLRSRLRKRGINGVLVAPGGFSGKLVEEAGQMGLGPVVLIGSGDLERLFFRDKPSEPASPALSHSWKTSSSGVRLDFESKNLVLRYRHRCEMPLCVAICNKQREFHNRSVTTPASNCRVLLAALGRVL